MGLIGKNCLKIVLDPRNYLPFTPLIILGYLYSVAVKGLILIFEYSLLMQSISCKPQQTNRLGFGFFPHFTSLYQFLAKEVVNWSLESFVTSRKVRILNFSRTLHSLTWVSLYFEKWRWMEFLRFLSWMESPFTSIFQKHKPVEYVDELLILLMDDSASY